MTTLSAGINDVDLKIMSIPPFTANILGVHFLTLFQSQPTQESSIKSINNSLTLPNNLTAFCQQEHYWIHHTCAALESILASTVNGTITLSTNVDDVNSKLSSTLSSATGFSDDLDYTPIKAKPLTLNTKTMDLQQRMGNREKNNLRLKLGGIAPPILKRQGMCPSQ